MAPMDIVFFPCHNRPQLIGDNIIAVFLDITEESINAILIGLRMGIDSLVMGWLESTVDYSAFAVSKQVECLVS